MKLTLNYIEYHSDIDFWKKQKGVKLENIEDDGWGEFMHTIRFTADDINEAKVKALEIMDGECSTSGVFCVSDGKRTVFTEEDLEA